MSPAKHRPKIIVVDDDARIRDLVKRYLTSEGMEVQVADGGQSLQKILEREFMDLIVLDLMLPQEDGLSICCRLRTEGNTIPIIMLTAKGEDVDRILGLEVGADDYLPKPFNPRELLARIHAVLRRRPEPEMPGAPTAQDEVLVFGSFVLDMAQRTLYKNGQEIEMTTSEFAMLKALARHPKQPLSRDKLAQLAQGRDFEPLNRSLDVQVSRLRKMLEDDPTNPKYLQTIWGLGYVFIPD